MADKGVNRFFRNWKVVLFSFLGAATFWFFTALNKDYSALVSYPIDIDFEEDSVVVMEPLPDIVKVDVSSGGWNLFRRTLLFSATPLRIPLDNPTDIRFLTRSTLLPLVKEQLSGLEVNYLMTDTIFINIEKKIQKQVEIRIDSVNISMAPNYRIVSPITIEPPVVTLSGPEAIINSLQDEYYVMVSRTRIDDDIDQDIEVPLPFEELMSSSPSTVNARFLVDRFDRDRITMPVEALNFPQDSAVQLLDSIITVNYTIQRGLKEDFSTEDFGITVDFNMVDERDSTIQPIIIYFPEIVSDLTLAPEVVKVKHGN